MFQKHTQSLGQTHSLWARCYRTSLVVLLLLAALLQGASIARADDEAHELLKKSTVWVVRPDGGSGSGALVDAKRRLIVTNAHVVGDHETVDVFSPLRNTKGENWGKQSYLDQKQDVRDWGYGTTGRVIAYSADKDLAIVQLDKNLRGLCEIALAKDAPKKDDGLHIVGNPASRPLFSYTFGGTRYVGPKKWTTDGIARDAETIRFSGHVWFGNSGGPVANKHGDLVGIISCGTEAECTAIAACEVRVLIDSVCERQVFSILNETKDTVRFEYRWSSETTWTSHSLKANHYRIWFPKSSSVKGETFHIRFNGGPMEHSFVLDSASVVLGSFEGDAPARMTGKCYSFQESNDGFNLFHIKR